MFSPASPLIGLTSFCPGIGRQHQRSPLEQHDYPHQQGSSRHTITKVAKDLGEDEDWLCDVASEMEIEDGAIWVYGVGEDGVQALTDFGIERLIELIQIYKENPELLKRWPPA